VRQHGCAICIGQQSADDDMRPPVLGQVTAADAMLLHRGPTRSACAICPCRWAPSTPGMFAISTGVVEVVACVRA
jgi:hypothetical protein